MSVDHIEEAFRKLYEENIELNVELTNKKWELKFARMKIQWMEEEFKKLNACSKELKKENERLKNSSNPINYDKIFNQIHEELMDKEKKLIDKVDTKWEKILRWEREIPRIYIPNL